MYPVILYIIHSLLHIIISIHNKNISNNCIGRGYSSQTYKYHFWLCYYYWYCSLHKNVVSCITQVYLVYFYINLLYHFKYSLLSMVWWSTTAPVSAKLVNKRSFFIVFNLFFLLTTSQFALMFYMGLYIHWLIISLSQFYFCTVI